LSHATEPAAAAPRMPRRSRIRDARIRTKLAAILLVPLIALVGLASLRLADSVSRAFEAELVQSLASVSIETSRLAHRLHQERIEAVRLLSGASDRDGYGRQQGFTDDAVASYQHAAARLGSVPDLVGDRLARINVQLDAVEELRRQVLGEQPVTTSAVILRYGAVLADVSAYQETLAGLIENPQLSERTRAVSAMAAARGHAADAEAIAHTAMATGTLTSAQRDALRASQTGQQDAFVAFRASASPQQRTVVAEAITGANVDTAEASAASLLQETGDLARAAVGLAGMVDITRYVEEELHQQLVDAITQTRDSVVRQVAAESAVVLLALAVTILVAALLARMLARSLHQLRDGAVAVAHHELPTAVARLSNPDVVTDLSPEALAAQIRVPDKLRSADEIGEVAEALTEVHRAAVRTAAEQAALRTSVAAMFLNLARRSQTLVDAVITRLDRLQRNEDDPKRLEGMFALDNLATRMRRNDENLLVLAGADSSPPRTRDALPDDVVRAAQSEIEHYERVEFGAIDDDVQVRASAINDVVRIVAELLDNATRFSPPDSPVVCEARRLGDQLVIQVEDRGVGMTSEEADRINSWLHEPQDVGVGVFRRMGIAVVARLAARHRIRVRLETHAHYGTTASVTLPAPVLVLPPSRRALILSPAAAPPVVPGRFPRRSGEVIRHQAGRQPQRRPIGSGPGPEPAAGQLPPSQMPVAGRPVHLTPYRESQPPQATIELPIFKDTTQAWFQEHGADGPSLTTGDRHDTPTPRQLPPTTAPEVMRSADGDPAVWRTAADQGWAAAAAAAEPSSAAATNSGLPKRVPQAQLVPGSVQPAAHTIPTQRRSPQQVRGLLSAYQRGVQQGRADHWKRYPQDGTR